MIICGMLRIFLSPSGGLINLLLGTSIDFINQSSLFRTIYIASGIWQEAGWGTIIYLATLSSVDTALYEAAKVDGASVFQRILHIDLPALVPMAVLQLILSASNLMNVGFEKIYLLQTDLNKAVSDTIAVYVYEQGILGAEYSYSTAIGLFNTAVNIVLLIVVSRIAKKPATYSSCKGGNAMSAQNQGFGQKARRPFGQSQRRRARRAQRRRHAAGGLPAVLHPGGLLLGPVRRLRRQGPFCCPASSRWMATKPSFRTTASLSVTGTASSTPSWAPSSSVVMIYITAYPLSNPDLPGRKFFNIFFVITMYFGGGLIPTYLVVRDTGLSTPSLRCSCPAAWRCPT